MPSVRVNGVTRAMWRVHRWLYAKTNGRMGGRIGEQNLLLLTTTGRHSGQPRPVVLTYLDDGEAKVVVASYAGEDRDPDWWLNLQANANATIRIGNLEQAVLATAVAEPERSRLYDRFIELHDQYSAYQQRTQRQIPVITLDPAA